MSARRAHLSLPPRTTRPALKGILMALDLIKDTGTPLDQQRFTWRELVPKPLSKLDDDAFTRVRVILMNGIEHEKLLFNAAAIRFSSELRPALGLIMRLEHFQQQMINWLLSPDM